MIKSTKPDTEKERIKAEQPAFDILLITPVQGGESQCDKRASQPGSACKRVKKRSYQQYKAQHLILGKKQNSITVNDSRNNIYNFIFQWF